MISLDDWPVAAPILFGKRLRLEPQRVSHAAEMATVLRDPELYAFTGGAPPTVDELRNRYRLLALGRSTDGSQRWLNWIVRRQRDGQAVGTTQATVIAQKGRLIARLAWVIVLEHQRLGYATEAATVTAARLRERGVEILIADVHPEHEASIKVARAVGLKPTDQIVDGEVRYSG